MCNHAQFAWFDAELEAIKTPKFSHISRDVAEEELIGFEDRYGALPSKYRTVLLTYGGASLFRDPEWGRYRIRFFRVPEIAYAGKKGEGTFADIGVWDDRMVYVHIKDGRRTFSPEILE
ncbi:MAG TPA: hypothetical protein VL282_09010, partial [Tepidisphaeraceae bacterium]|nr:hypothetical protein [Tepidisphaeraceae bacterium]